MKHDRCCFFSCWQAPPSLEPPSYFPLCLHTLEGLYFCWIPLLDCLWSFLHAFSLLCCTAAAVRVPRSTTILPSQTVAISFCYEMLGWGQNHTGIHVYYVLLPIAICYQYSVYKYWYFFKHVAATDSNMTNQSPFSKTPFV